MSWRRGGSLQNLYWHLRMVRPGQEAVRRKLYRYIADEKKRLIKSGVDAEEIRLLCRHLINPRNRQAERAYLFYKAQLHLFEPYSCEQTI